METKKRPHVATKYPEELTLRFDPNECECRYTRAIFSPACKDFIARTLYLLWRYNHLTGPEFAADVVSISIRIRDRNPTNVAALKDCFGCGNSIDFTVGDVAGFCENALPFFTGEKSISYRVEL